MLEHARVNRFEDAAVEVLTCPLEALDLDCGIHSRLGRHVKGLNCPHEALDEPAFRIVLAGKMRDSAVRAVWGTAALQYQDPRASFAECGPAAKTGPERSLA